MPKIHLNYEQEKLEIVFDTDMSMVFELKRCSLDIRDHLALHGAVQQISVKEAKAQHAENKYELAVDAIQNLYDVVHKPKAKRPLGLILKAVARIQKLPPEKYQELYAEWNDFSPQEQKIIIDHPQVVNVADLIWYEREAEAYKHPQLKELRRVPDLNVTQREATIQCSNNRTLLIELARVHDVIALTLYGAKQKIADSYAGISDVHEQAEAVMEIIQTLYSGSWTQRANHNDSAVDLTLMTKKVCRDIAEWMQWPHDRVQAAVSKLTEDEQSNLLGPGAKQLLIQHSGNLAKNCHPSSRQISDLLDNVIDSFNITEKARTCSAL